MLDTNAIVDAIDQSQIFNLIYFCNKLRVSEWMSVA